MKKEMVKEILRKRSMRIGSVVLAAAIVFSGGMWAWNESNTSAPELVTYVDTEESGVEIIGEDVPLAAPKVTTSTKTKTKTKNVKLKKASTKTYVDKGTTKTTKNTKTKKSGSTTTTTVTVKEVTTDSYFTKGSTTKKQVTTTKTTVTKTVLAQDGSESGTVATKTAAAANATGEVSISSIAPQLDSRVANAANKIGVTITVNPSVSYSGLFDARTRSVTLKKADVTVYHELGHFLAFVAGNYDTTPEFQAIFNREKSAYTAYNKAYVLANSSEYFAESFKNYTLEPQALKSSRPETYAAIEKALSKVTDAQVNNIITVYGAIWK